MFSFFIPGMLRLTNYLIGCCDLVLIQSWIKVMYCSLLWLTLHIRAGINISHLSIPGIVAHGRCYISHCFVLCMCVRAFLTVCRVVLVFLKCVINLTSFLFKSRFISLLLFIHLFIFFLLIKQLFSHKKAKVSRLFCLLVLFLELKL